MTHGAPQGPLVPGQVVAGRYRIEKILGQGGMGVVAAARHIDLDELYALKVMMIDATITADWVERFVREARMAAKLRSVHAAKVFDSGRLPDGAPYLAMEYLQGRDLSYELHARGPLPPAEVAAYIMQACDVLGEAHSMGIVHRDIKPANLFLTRLPSGAPCVKVLDFGIAKQDDPLNAPRMTQTAHVFGTPLYMSPEHMKSAKSVDARSDIWSLGILMYELCTGAVPYEGESITALVAAVMTEPPVPPSKRRPGIGAEMEAVILRCLERDPARRYQTAAALAQALAPIAGIAARPVLASYPEISIPVSVNAAPSAPWAAGATERAITSSSVRAAARSRSGLVLGLAAFGVGLVAILGLIALRFRSDATGASSPELAAPPMSASASATGPEILPAPPPSAAPTTAPGAAEPSATATSTAPGGPGNAPTPTVTPRSPAASGTPSAPNKTGTKTPTRPTASPSSTRGGFF